MPKSDPFGFVSAINWDVVEAHSAEINRIFEQPRCEILARKGTGIGPCDRPLDIHGQCDRAASHQEG